MLQCHAHAPLLSFQAAAAEPVARAERIIMLGWRVGVPDMVREFDDYVGPGSELVRGGGGGGEGG